MKKKSLLIVLITLQALWLKAQTWDGSTNTSWNEPTNWSTNTVPTASGNVIIPTGLMNYPVLASNVTISTIDMRTGSSLDVNGFTLTVNTVTSNYTYFTGATLNNSNGSTDIVLTINNGSAGYTTYFRGNTINDKITINLGGSNDFLEGEGGGNTYTQAATFNVNGTGSFWISSNSLSTFASDLTINRTVAGLVDLFTAGGSVGGNFSYTNLIGNDGTRIGNASISTLINGTININANHTLLPNVFEMERVINLTQGGSINVTNSRGLDIRKDTLKVTTLTAAGYRGSSYAYLYDNHITGNISIADSSTYAGGYATYIRNNFIDGNAHFESNSSNSFFEADAANSGNRYTGNVEFIVTGTGVVYISNADTSTFGGNLSVIRTGAGGSDLFESGGNISGNFSFSNNSAGNLLLGSLSKRTSIGGMVNINVNDTIPGIFQMYRLINQTGGGIINVQNSRGFEVERDTLLLNSMTISGYRGNEYGTLYNNSITGNITISDHATYGAGYSTHIRTNVITGNSSFTNNGLNNFYDADNSGSGNRYTGNVTITATGPGDLYVSNGDTTVIDGNLTITRTSAGITDAFNSGGIIGGNFTFSNNVAGNSLFGTTTRRTSVGGTINITINNNSTPGSFQLLRVINQIGGGTISVQNSRGFEVERDTLLLNSMTISGYRGNEYGTLYNNSITGNITISDHATYGAGYSTHIRTNVITGNSSFTNNGLNVFYDADNSGSGNKYIGNVAYTRNATSISVGAGDTTEISGNLTLNSATGITLSKIKFNGTTDGSIEQLGIQPIIIPQLIMEKTGTGKITLNDSVTISTSLFFNGGNIVSSPSNKLIFLDNATHSGASDASHVIGHIQKNGNDAFTFPTGTATTLNYVAMTAPAAGSVFSAQYLKRSPHADGYDTSAHAPTMQRISNCEYWDVKREAGTSNVTLTFSFAEPCAGSSYYITDPSKARIARWTGSIWEDLGNGGSTGTTTGTVTTAGPVMNFSPFTFGSVDIVANPLPLILKNFSAAKESSTIKLSWQTVSEVNVSHFEIEKSINGRNFNSIQNVAARGGAQNTYQAVDINPVQGKNYYRLKMTDVNGQFKYSPVVMIDFSGKNFISLFPNPANDFIKIYTGQIVQSLNIMDMNGRMVKQLLPSADNQYKIDDLQKGIYFVRIKTETEIYTLKFSKL